MTKLVVIGAVLLGLGACTQQVPDSGQGVGFGDYATYEVERARREAQLGATGGPGSTTVVPPSGVAVAGTGGLPAPQAVASSELAAAGIGGTAPMSATQPLDATPGNAPPPVLNNPGISDEQNFDAVAARETIQSDAARRAEQAANMEIIQPTAVPTRTGNAGPNIVQFALDTRHPKGTAVYSRSLLSGEGRFLRNCGKYGSPDEAQRDFLSRGGPERDRLGIDPDGDGFACGWDPAPFRTVASGN